MIELTNMGPNLNVVTLGHIQIWFNTNTSIAYQVLSFFPVVRKNEWGSITEKHLNLICMGRKTRISGDLFLKQLDAAYKQIEGA